MTESEIVQEEVDVLPEATSLSAESANSVGSVMPISGNEEKMMRGRQKLIIPLFGLFLGICNRRQSRFSVSEVSSTVIS